MTPFLVVKLFTDFGVAGVLALMIGLLFILISTVAALGIELRWRSLEDLASGTGDIAVTRQTAIAR